MGYYLDLQSECLRNHCAFFHSSTLLRKCFDVLRNLSSLLRLLDHHILMSSKSKFLLTIYPEVSFHLEIHITGLFLVLVTSSNAGSILTLRVLRERPLVPPGPVPVGFIIRTSKVFGTDTALL